MFGVTGWVRRCQQAVPLIGIAANRESGDSSQNWQLDTRKTSPLGLKSDSLCPWRFFMDPSSFFSLSDHLERLSKDGDPLEVLERTVDFEYFRTWLVEGLEYSDGSKGGRPPFDPVSMFKVLILQTQHNLSDAKMEFIIRDRLSWMRFLGFALGEPMPDENTIRPLPQPDDGDRHLEAGDEGV